MFKGNNTNPNNINNNQQQSTAARHQAHDESFSYQRLALTDTGVDR